MSKPNELRTVLFIPDTHAPYHDARAFDLLERVAKAIKPKVCVIGGDFADFYAISSHSKSPGRCETFMDEVRGVRHLLRRVESWGMPERHYIMGNHEDRYSRYIMDNAAKLDGVTNVDELLKLADHGWRITPYKDHTTLGKLWMTHDIGKAGANAVKDAMNAYQDNIVINHLHRMIFLVEGNAKGIPHVAACFGWLGDRTKVDYMYKVKANRDWALGFGLGYLRDNGFMYLQPVPIVQYSVVVEGKLFTA